MTKYLFACQQNDMTWTEHEFRSMNDDLAISYGLENRTSNMCKLYQNERLIATFDGLAVLEGGRQQASQLDNGLGLTTKTACFHHEAAELHPRF